MFTHLLDLAHHAETGDSAAFLANDAFSVLSASLIRDIEKAQPDFAPSLKDIRADGWFSSEHRADATAKWLRYTLDKDPTFHPMSFLQRFCDENAHRDGPLVILAQLHQIAGNRDLAIKNIDTATSLSQFDLHSQNVARTIRAWVNNDLTSEKNLDDYLKTHICAKPFKTLETTPDGLVYLCCPAWLPVAVGDINTQSTDQIWRGPIASEIRDSIIDGSYKYCSRTHCEVISNRNLTPRESEQAQSLINSYAKSAEQAIPGPETVILSHDRSCNLSCPSCRTELILASKNQQAALDAIMESTVLPLLKSAKTLHVTGSGDPFGSNHFRRILKRTTHDDFPGLTIDLHTNGLLFDKKAWDDLALDGRIRYAQLSIDAATSETYRHVRRGGSFDRLLKNLEFLGTMRTSGQIARLEFSMVVQTRNFAEMPDFVRLGLQFKADAASFSMIRNWGTFTQQEFDEEFIGSSKHPRHSEFVAILNDPMMANPIANIGNMKSYATA